MSNGLYRTIQLALLLSPFFLFAHTIKDGDEFWKGGFGVVMAGVLAAYKTWKGTGDE